MGPVTDIPWIEYAVAGAPLVAGTASGDLCRVCPYGGGVLVAVIDGLGHGPEAAEAARVAADALEEHPEDPPSLLLERCHLASKSTRGVAMTLASMRAYGSLTWIGVGNVEAVLVPSDPAQPRESPMLRGGIVGLRLPPLRERTVTIAPGDTIVFATDGLRSGFADHVDEKATPAAIAESVFSRYRKTSDDALVVVARWLGPSR
jgi:hypothetical protein